MQLKRQIGGLSNQWPGQRDAPDNERQEKDSDQQHAAPPPFPRANDSTVRAHREPRLPRRV